MVTQEEDCLRVQCGGKACAAGEEVNGTNMVVNSEVMVRSRPEEAEDVDVACELVVTGESVVCACVYVSARPV